MKMEAISGPQTIHNQLVSEYSGQFSFTDVSPVILMEISTGLPDIQARGCCQPYRRQKWRGLFQDNGEFPLD